MRWLLVYHDSWLTFWAGLLGAILLRGVLSAALVGLAWPARVPRPTAPPGSPFTPSRFCGPVR
ncbi:hypothetical protein [Micromonospora sp. NPDC023814]|uniref:hypothetical protein n=1 Tax=Micromonospora sp. NPDC023814 TaxID=3154596 RepID=UPI0033C2B76B